MTLKIFTVHYFFSVGQKNIIEVTDFTVFELLTCSLLYRFWIYNETLTLNCLQPSEKDSGQQFRHVKVSNNFLPNIFLKSS